MKIFLDDQGRDARKDWVPEDWRRAVNFFEFRALVEGAIESGEKIEAISFDNDLGEGELEGWEIARWLYENHPEIMNENPELRVHSANPEGRKSLEHHLNFWRKNWEELVEARKRPDPWSEIKIK
jgi:hypothetical protein